MTETTTRKKPEPVIEDTNLEIRPEEPPTRTRRSKYDPLVDRIVDIEDEGWFRIGGEFPDTTTAAKVRTAIQARLKARGYGPAFKLKSQRTEDGAGVWVSLADEEGDEAEALEEA